MSEVALIAGEEDDERYHQFGPDGAHEARFGQELLIADGFGDHPRKPGGKNGIGQNSVRRTLDGDDIGQPDEAGLGGRVVRFHRLPEIARRRRDEDEAAVLLFGHHLVRGLAQVETTVQMDLQHLAPVVGGELVERNAVEDAGIADHGIESPEGVDSGIDDRLAALRAVDRVVRCDRASACAGDLLDHLVGHARVGTLPAHRATQVVDHHRSASPRQIERVEPAEPASGARHDRHLSFEFDQFALLINRVPTCWR